MDKKISVVIPFFRRERVFEETLNSVLSQTVKPYEIIVVDDASGGGATEFLSQFTHQIKLITLKENQGVSNARNIGAREAEGDYIAFLDSDDTWLPEKLEKQLDYLEKNSECDLCHTGTVNYYPDGTEKEYLAKPKTLTVKELTESSHLVFPCVLMRKDDFLDSGGFDPSYRQTEDYEFSMRLVTNGYRIDFIAEPLLRVRQGSNDKISSNWWGFIKGHIRVVWKYREYYQELYGNLGLYKHIVKYLIKGGYKRGGIVGKALRISGRVLYPGINV